MGAIVMLAVDDPPSVVLEGALDLSLRRDRLALVARAAVCALGGLWPFGFHLWLALLHGANALLLFALLQPRAGARPGTVAGVKPLTAFPTPGSDKGRSHKRPGIVSA